MDSKTREQLEAAKAKLFNAHTPHDPSPIQAVHKAAQKKEEK